MPAVTSRQVGRVRRFIREHVAGSEVGRRWLALVAPHWPEVLSRLTTDPAARMAAQRAVGEALRLVALHAAGHTPRVDARATAAGLRVIEALEVGASASMRPALATLRRELGASTGREFRQVLGVNEPA